ncbi:MAG: alanyl-tRNA editing protein [Micavibrio sp.]
MTQKIFLEDCYRREIEAHISAVEGNAVQLDQTVFYAASGGQPGDTGMLRIANENIPVVTTKKGAAHDEVWHVLPEDAVPPPVGTALKGSIDWETRHKYMRMHTCLHLLCSLIEGDVTGGSVGAEKGRLDFNISADAVDKEALNKSLNDLIEADHPVSYEWLSDEELAANPSLIRTMSVKPPVGSGAVRLVRIGPKDSPVDFQPCGGTHVRSTAEIGRVEISKIENKGKQNRRISVVFA